MQKISVVRWRIPSPAYLLLLGFVFFTGCRVQFVPKYDEQLMQQIGLAAKATDKLYLDLLDAPNEARNYGAFSGRYNEIESEISSIKMKNESREKNEHFVAINKNLLDAFAEAKQYHKTKGTLSNGEIQSYRASLNAFWKPLYLAEKGLKQ